MKRLTLTYTMGLPGSGKSHWAKLQLNGENTTRVNKDSIRAMIHNGRWSPDQERFTVEVRDTLIRLALVSGHNVIVDDTNLDPIHAESFKSIANALDADLVLKDFRHVPLKTCLEQNKSPERIVSGSAVPEHVIFSMYRKWLLPKIQAPKWKRNLRDCIIVDLDGTLFSNNGHRDWYDETKVYYDDVREDVANVIKAIKADVIFCVSARTLGCYPETERCLRDKVFEHSDTWNWLLLMRECGDKRLDPAVKQEIYEQHIRDKYNVVGVFDDHPGVLRMWQSYGLTTFNVGHMDLEI